MTAKPTSRNTARDGSPSNKPFSDMKNGSKRSRSEIEKALSGRPSRSKKKARPAPSSALDLGVPPRRQQVLGGNLTGVANHPKLGIFSRYSDISVMNWVAFVITLLILVAFFWPQENNSTQEVIGRETALLPQLGETDLSEDEQIDFLENQGELDALSFSRDDDSARATVFRKQDAQDLKIRSLLEKANTEINNGKYTQPKNANATETYRTVLAINPKNVEAKQGLEYVTTRFLTSGHSALEQDNQTIAENALSKLELINKNSEEYRELELALEAWKLDRQISVLLTNAKSAFGKRALTFPAKSNALYFYQQTLLLDETNQIALVGIQKIADSYIQLANDAVLTAQFETASAHLTTVSIIDATHSSIPLVEAMIARAKFVADQQNRLEEQATQSLENDTSTPTQQTSEQEAFDKQYLKQGLEAYDQSDYDTASALLQPLADKGIAQAQFRLAYMHFLGRGFRLNRKTAEDMIRSSLPAIQKFADEGRPWAQTDLGNLYEDGLVLSRRYADAVFWYRAAADKGYSRAQTNLGSMYARGLGVDTNTQTAIEWFQLAADQGDDIAQLNLDAMSAN